MGTYRIAVLPGDGIGPEVMAEAVKALRQAEERSGGFHLELTTYPAGAWTYLETGTPLPAETIEGCRAADAVLLAAMGLPSVRWPDGTEMVPQIALREIFALYAGVRPIRFLPGARSVLLRPQGIDFVIVRENTEGLFASRTGGLVLHNDVAADLQIITRRGTERVVRAAFELARQRKAGAKAHGKRPRVTCVDKANVFRSSAFFRRVFDEVAADYPEVAADHLYVDAAALALVQQPQRFDVLVMENMYGDILSDLAAGLIGGLGLAPSGDIGTAHAVFQPSHGTAPDIAGQGIANPVAMILSAAMMLDWLADRHGDAALSRAGQALDDAVAAALADGAAQTPDQGGNHTTSAVGDAVAARI